MGIAKPGAPPHHFGRHGIRGDPGTGIDWCTAVGVMVIIGTPFVDVAVHVVQPKGIGPKTVGVHWSIAIVFVRIVTDGKVRKKVNHLRCHLVTKAKGGGCPGSAGIFPLGFAWQPIGPSRQLA